MKKHAKKALKHDVSVLGKTVPTLAIAALFLVGGGTAATLTYFGQVTGTANVDQAVLVDGTSGETTVDIFDSSEPITAGETVVDTFEIRNNMDSEYSPNYDSELTVTEVESESTEATYQRTGSNLDWTDGDNQVGLDTTYANYFSDAGHDFGAVDVDSESAAVVVDSTDGDNPDTISAGIDELEEAEDTVFVADIESSYDGFTVDASGVTVASDGASIDGQVTINADDVTFTGFEVTHGDGNLDAIRVQTNTVNSGEISNNRIYGVEDGTGIYLNHANAASSLTISDNTIEGNFAGIGGTESFEGSVDYNVFKSNDEAIGVGDDEFSTEGNRFEDNTATFRIYSGDYSEDPSVDAEDNFFAEPFNVEFHSGTSLEEGDVSASYQTVDSVRAGETVKVGVVNDFDLMIDGSYDYTLTTDITAN